jgi:hypothetical protein
MEYPTASTQNREMRIHRLRDAFGGLKPPNLESRIEESAPNSEFEIRISRFEIPNGIRPQKL